MEVINIIANIMVIPLLMGVCMLMYYMIDDIRLKRKNRRL